MKAFLILISLSTIYCLSEEEILRQSKRYYINSPNILQWFSLTNGTDGDHYAYAFWLNNRLYVPLHLSGDIIPGRNGSVHYDLLVYDQNLQPVSTTTALEEEHYIQKGCLPNNSLDLYSVTFIEYKAPIRLHAKNGLVFAQCWKNGKWNEGIYSKRGTSGFPYVFFIPIKGPKIWIERAAIMTMGHSAPLLPKNETPLRRYGWAGDYEPVNGTYHRFQGPCSYKKVAKTWGRLDLSNNTYIKRITHENYNKLA